MPQTDIEVQSYDETFEENTASGSVPGRRENTASGDVPGRQENKASGNVPGRRVNNTNGNVPGRRENNASGNVPGRWENSASRNVQGPELQAVDNIGYVETGDEELEDVCAEVPIFPKPLAIFLCVLNVIVPGLGCMVASVCVCCCSKNLDAGDKCCFGYVCFITGLGMLITSFCPCSWLLSISWGVQLIEKSNYYNLFDNEGNHQNTTTSTSSNNPNTERHGSHEPTVPPSQTMQVHSRNVRIQGDVNTRELPRMSRTNFKFDSSDARKNKQSAPRSTATIH